MNVSGGSVTAAQLSADQQGDISQTKGWRENAVLSAEIGNADSMEQDGEAAEEQSLCG